MAPQKYYTVGVSNKFAAFGADSDASSDDGEVILAAPPPVTTEQQDQLGQAAAGGKKKKPLPQQQQQHSPQRERQGRPPRGGRGGFGGEGRGAFRGSRGRGDSAAEAPEETYGMQVMPEEGDNAHRRRGGFRGRRGGPPGSLGGAPGYPRREFDRHSGTGRSSEAKKHGAGGHNWGQTESENQFHRSESLLGEGKASKEDGAQEPGEAEEGAEKEGAPPAPVEEEEPTIDLDTYKKLQAEKRANLPTFVSARASSKPIETEKELAAQGYVRLSRGEEEEAEESHEESPNAREDRPKKKAINVYEYVHSEGGRVPFFGRRGGRGGARGGRDDRVRRGAPGGAPNRTPRSRESAPDLKDTQAFPTLGAR